MPNLNSARIDGLLPLLRSNRWFIATYLLLFLVATILLGLTPLGDEILWLNARRQPFWDTFFRYGTRLAEPISYLSLITVLLFIRYRTALVLPLVGLSAFLMSLLSKWVFSTDRPINYFRNNNLFEQLQLFDNYQLIEGTNSFPSGHTMSAFALFGFVAFSSPNKRTTGPLMLLLALTVALSRVYLLAHFLRDIYLGSLIGIGLAALWYFLQFRLFTYPHPWLDGSLLRRQPFLPATDTLPAVEEVSAPDED